MVADGGGSEQRRELMIFYTKFALGRVRDSLARNRNVITFNIGTGTWCSARFCQNSGGMHTNPCDPVWYDLHQNWLKILRLCRSKMYKKGDARAAIQRGWPRALLQGFIQIDKLSV